MSTKRQILEQAGRELGDTSANFQSDILAPAFDFILADLTEFECLAAIRRTATFTIVQDARDYETREITQLTPHYPADIIRLTVWAWGHQQPRRARNDWEFEQRRLFDGDDKRGRPLLWRLYPNKRVLEVHPPADAEHAGAECEVLFYAPWEAVDLDGDVVQIEKEDVNVVMLGIKWKASFFSEMLAQDRQITFAAYEAGKKRMWGRRWVRSSQAEAERHAITRDHDFDRR